MAIKWKTSCTFHNWVPPSEEVKNEILAQCATFQNEGKYTGGYAQIRNPANPSEMNYERWWWSDETTASQYLEIVELAWPNMQKTISITSEEVPD